MVLRGTTRASMSLPHYEDASGVLEIKQSHIQSQLNSLHSKHTLYTKELIGETGAK